MSNYSSKELIKKLQKAGFVLDRIKGSHHIYKHQNGKRTIVPHPKKDLPKGTFNSILKQAGLK
ncbi:type II toxin-antitoxin system HicA family toxin [Reichenbachiella sp. MALMAid0571]|uniref:type II toxin-antitoxin system HicA family toxin n=1 Tax=Reichenbachiella sp. MALMAid0571 TaxID=3143939 RepID=UPI0032DE7B03